MNSTEAMLRIVDFVEEFGGNLEGTDRTHLIFLVQDYSKAIFAEALAESRGQPVSPF